MDPYVKAADIDYAVVQVFDLLRGETDLVRRIDTLRTLRHALRETIFEEIDRAIVQMRLDGWTNGQIADALGITAPSVPKRFRSIRKRRGWDVPYGTPHHDISDYSSIPAAVRIKKW